MIVPPIKQKLRDQGIYTKNWYVFVFYTFFIGSLSNLNQLDCKKPRNDPEVKLVT